MSRVAGRTSLAALAAAAVALMAVAVAPSLAQDAGAPSVRHGVQAAGAFVAAAPSVATQPRKLLDAAEQQVFRGVGRLDLGDAFCTAALFAPDRALTAAHCVHDLDGTPRQPARMWFRAGLRDGEQQAIRQVRRYAIHPDYRWNGPKAGWEEIAADVAMLELDQPLLTTDFPTYEPGDLPPPGGAVALLSYASGRDRALSLQEPCRVTARRGAVAQLDCDVAPGSSGSPVLARDADGRLRLAGVISARGPQGAYASVAADALPLLARAIEGQEIRRAEARPEDQGGLGSSLRAGGWKTSRPPQP